MISTKQLLINWSELLRDRNNVPKPSHFNLGNYEFIGTITDYKFNGTMIDHCTEKQYEIKGLYLVSFKEIDNNPYRILDYALFKENEFKYLETYKHYTILKASLNPHNSEYVIKELGFNTRWASLTYCKKYIKEKLGQEEK